jgi:CIC family chloride channel protein
VADAANRLVGIFSVDDVRPYFYDETLWDLADVRDIMTTRLVTVTSDDDLNTAIQRFTELNLDELPVVTPGDAGQLLGMLRRKDAIGVYNECLLKLKQATLEET